MTRDHHADDSSQEVDHAFILVGNPGAGKSSLLNWLAGKPLFAAGYSAGVGLTMKEDYKTGCIGTKQVSFVNLPGIRESEKMEMTLTALKNAVDSQLKLNIPVKLAFVARLDSGRPIVDDLALINIVVQSTTEPGSETNKRQIYVIFNKCSAEDMSLEKQNIIKPIADASLAPANVNVVYHFIRRGPDDMLPDGKKEEFMNFVQRIESRFLKAKDLVDRMLTIGFDFEMEYTKDLMKEANSKRKIK